MLSAFSFNMFFAFSFLLIPLCLTPALLSLLSAFSFKLSASKCSLLLAFSLLLQALTPKLSYLRSMILLQQFSKQYDGRTILQVPEFRLAPGIHWLKGVNGSGKSTLMKCLAGMLPYHGSAVVQQWEVARHLRQVRRVVNYAEAEPLLPGFLTGMELVDFFVNTKGGSKATCLEQAAALQFTAALPQRVETYSSGMLKKLSLLLAFCGRPAWIFLDEPLVTLDVAAVQVVLQLIEQYAGQGVSFLLTSHQDMDLPNNGLPLHGLAIEHQNLVAL